MPISFECVHASPQVRSTGPAESVLIFVDVHRADDEAVRQPHYNLKI
jgi:hypothetical protein